MPQPQFLDLSQISALNAKRDELKEQIARAQALGQPSGRKYATWGGALAGGLGDVLGGIAGKAKEERLAEELGKNREAEQGLVGQFNTALMRPDATPDEREQLAFGGIASGHPALAATGQAMVQSGDRKLTRALREEERKRAAEQAATDDARQAAALEETKRHNKFNEENPVPIVGFGQGGQMVVLPGRMPAAAPPVARPVMTPDNQPVIKPNDLSTSDKEALKAAADDVAASNELVSTFKDEFVGGGAGAGKIAEVVDAYGSGGGVAGKLIGAGSKALGGLGEEGIKERATWFREYDRFVNLPQRNKVFGASLSAGEKSSWDAAAEVTRGNDPVAARKALLWMQAKANEKLGGLRESTMAEGANPAAVNALTRRAGPPLGAAPPLDTSTPIIEPPRVAKPQSAADEIIEYGGKRYRRGPNGEAVPL